MSTVVSTDDFTAADGWTYLEDPETQVDVQWRWRRKPHGVGFILQWYHSGTFEWVPIDGRHRTRESIRREIGA